MKRLPAILLVLLLSGATYAQTNDTFRVYFSMRDARLTAKAKDYIDSLMFKAALTHFQKLIILGYADNTGGKGLNDSLSLARARSVQQYLVASGSSEKDITLVTGKGQVDRAKNTGGYPEDRKVLIIVDRTTGTPTVVQQPARVSLFAAAKVNETISLDNIFFQAGSDILLPSAAPEMDTLYHFLLRNPTVKILITGNICCIGEPTGRDIPFYQTTLSVARAQKVYETLAERGIRRDRMQYTGVGNGKPRVYPEKGEADAVRNRRVDVKILSR